MIDYLRGRLAALGADYAIVEMGGVALRVTMPPPPESLRRQLGAEVTIYTRLLVREDEISLYGFLSPDDRNLFNLVLGVSGFGPRLALALFGVFSAEQLCRAVLEENITLLCQAPGVGRKTAQRLVFELKEKLPQVAAIGIGAALPAEQISPRDEIVEALCTLGFSRLEAAASVNRVMGEQPQATREEWLRLALKELSGS
ncbi:MAG: Holliday junction branch migration protein RuvA [Firmicutes bacterium]|jgi:Holliday junction DNA helicase RuvA|nr:Holliday junction branch migration protein RuvA [Bacillota bacterium]